MTDWVQTYRACASSLGLRLQSAAPSTRLSEEAVELFEATVEGESHGVAFLDRNGQLVVLLVLVQTADSIWISRLSMLDDDGAGARARALVQLAQHAIQRLPTPVLRLGRSTTTHWGRLGFEPQPDGSWCFAPSVTIDCGDSGTHATDVFGSAEPTSTDATLPGEVELPEEEGSTWDLKAGLVLGEGRFQLEGYLGGGAMGEVWEALDRRLGGQVAIKILRAEHKKLDSHRARFEQEVGVTAQLDHPAVVSVLDTGSLEDGRPWFAMERVRGVDLHEALRTRRPAPSADLSKLAGWIRRMANVLLVVAQAVASAHDRGIVHRDIKPSNIMLGPFGQVLLMDWGVARNLAQRDAFQDLIHTPVDLRRTTTASSTRAGQRVGTPAYMAPEQALGQAEAVGPAADVFAVGITLYEVLVGRLPPRRRASVALELVEATLAQAAVPTPLVDIVLQALQTRAADRPSASELAALLQDFLDGTARRERAETIYQEAMRAGPAAAQLRDEAQARFDTAAAMLARVPSVGDPEQRVPAWRVEAEATRLLERAVAAELGVEQQLRGALELWDGHTASRTALVELYMTRVLQAERARDPGAAHAAEAMLRRLKHPSSESFLQAQGAVSLWTTPSGARVTAHRLEEVDRRRVSVEVRELGPTPLTEVPLGRGSWVLEIEAPGRQTVRYPIAIERGEHWHGVAPGDTQPTAIHLPPIAELSDAEVYVPAGWFLAGGDPQACESVSRRRIWVDAMVVRRNLMTLDEWWAWRTADPEGMHPDTLDPWGGRYRDQPTVVKREGVFHCHGGHSDFTHRSGQHPALAVGPVNALRWADWVATRPGGRWSWQLPTEWMWEKAARGVDGRTFPWGDHFDPGFCVCLQVAGDPQSQPVGSQPLDVGPYGLLDTAGQVRELTGSLHSKDGDRADGERASFATTRTLDPEAWYIVRGGSYFSNPAFCRLAGRYAMRPLTAGTAAGVRLFAPYRPARTPPEERPGTA